MSKILKLLPGSSFTEHKGVFGIIEEFDLILTMTG